MAPTFHVADYIVFVISLLIPLGIGIFFKFRTRNRQSTTEYLLGGRQMGCLVLGFSLMASFFNAIFLIGAPAEVYYFGLIWILKLPSYILNCSINCVLIVPFFRRFTYSSGYQYLEFRYKSKIPRLIAAFGFSLYMISFLAVVMYAPALVFNQVSGLNVNVAIASCGLVCVAYTFMGGIRAVLWTDAVQTVIILVSFSAMSVIGISRIGGWQVFTTSVMNSQRVNFLTFDTNLNTRHTFWTQIFGEFFINLCFSNQMGIQRFLAAKSTKVAQIAYMVNTLSACVLAAFTALIGLIVYVYFADCDPMVAGLTTKRDQLVPHFVMEVFGMYPGIPGCFIAAIFAAALSTVSSIVNSLSLVTVEDFVKPIYSSCTKQDLTDSRALVLSKAFTALYGILSMCLAFATPYMSTVLLQIPVIIMSCIGAPMNTLFAMSIFWPFTNVWGATGGSLLGLAFGLFLALSKMIHGSKPIPLPVGQCLSPCPNETMATAAFTLSTEQVMAGGNEDWHVSNLKPGSMADYFGNLSYMWYPVMTWVVTATSCILISSIAKCFGLSDTDTGYLYNKGLVYYGYKTNKNQTYKSDIDYASEPVLLKHFNHNPTE